MTDTLSILTLASTAATDRNWATSGLRGQTEYRDRPPHGHSRPREVVNPVSRPVFSGHASGWVREVVRDAGVTLPPVGLATPREGACP